MRLTTTWIVLANLSVCARAASPDCQIANTRLTFATLDQARTLLSTADPFVSSLGAFDRSARLKMARPIDQKEFLVFIGTQAQDWTDDERRMLSKEWCEMASRIAGHSWRLRLPAAVLLVKTTGREEGNAPYTRGNAILLPVAALAARAWSSSILPHELFHLLSRELDRVEPSRRDALYALVNYAPLGGPLELPPALRDRKITNPDSYQIAHSVTVLRMGQPIQTVPFLLASTSTYVGTRGEEFFQYLQFRLLAVQRIGTVWSPQLGPDQQPLLIDPATTNYLDRVGRNTEESFQADEVLAESFALALGYGDSHELPNPEIPRHLDAALKQLSGK